MLVEPISDELENVGDVDFVAADEFHFEHEVVGDRFLFALGLLTEFAVELGVGAAVIPGSPVRTVWLPPGRIR